MIDNKVGNTMNSYEPTLQYKMPLWLRVDMVVTSMHTADLGARFID